MYHGGISSENVIWVIRYMECLLGLGRRGVDQASPISYITVADGLSKLVECCVYDVEVARLYTKATVKII